MLGIGERLAERECCCSPVVTRPSFEFVIGALEDQLKKAKESQGDTDDAPPATRNTSTASGVEAAAVLDQLVHFMDLLIDKDLPADLRRSPDLRHTMPQCERKKRGSMSGGGPAAAAADKAACVPGSPALSSRHTSPLGRRIAFGAHRAKPSAVCIGPPPRVMPHRSKSSNSVASRATAKRVKNNDG